jgi:hypothetical protein
MLTPSIQIEGTDRLIRSLRHDEGLVSLRASSSRSHGVSSKWGESHR